MRVVYCRACSDGRDDRTVPLYGNVMKGRAHGYYRCVKCGQRVRDDRMEAAVEHYVLEVAGSRELRRRTVIPGDDHAADIRKAERDLEAMRGLSTRSDAIKAAVDELETRLTKLRNMPHEADRIEWVPTGETVAEHWAQLDRDGRGAFLRGWDVVAYADHEGLTVGLGWLDADSDVFKVG